MRALNETAVEVEAIVRLVQSLTPNWRAGERFYELRSEAVARLRRLVNGGVIPLQRPPQPAQRPPRPSMPAEPQKPLATPPEPAARVLVRAVTLPPRLRWPAKRGRLPMPPLRVAGQLRLDV
jgi:hypothetical protein